MNNSKACKLKWNICHIKNLSVRPDVDFFSNIYLQKCKTPYPLIALERPEILFWEFFLVDSFKKYLYAHLGTHFYYVCTYIIHIFYGWNMFCAKYKLIYIFFSCQKQCLENVMAHTEDLLTICSKMCSILACAVPRLWCTSRWTLFRDESDLLLEVLHIFSVNTGSQNKKIMIEKWKRMAIAP